MGAGVAALLALAAAYFSFRPDGFFPRIEARIESGRSLPPPPTQTGVLESQNPLPPAEDQAENMHASAPSAETQTPPDLPAGSGADTETPGGSPILRAGAQGVSGIPGSGVGSGSAVLGADHSGSRPGNALSGKNAGSSAGTGSKTGPLRHVPPSRGDRGSTAGEQEENTVSDINKMLASAGMLRGPAGTFPLLQTALRGGKGGLLFDPRKVTESGGRAGQGQVSMERNSIVTPENFDLSAKGLGASKGKEPPGPKIPAGRAPALPSSHLPYILQAAAQTGVDPALIAATAARESNFRYGAYRAEPQLKSVAWREAPGKPLQKYFDGSVGPMQVLRSNFLSRGIDNDADANNLANNYRIGAQIIRGDMNAFPGNSWKSVAAYNVGVYGAKVGRVPAGNYTDTILTWRTDYEKAIAPYR